MSRGRRRDRVPATVRRRVRARRLRLLGWTALLWVPALVCGTLLIGTTLASRGALADYRDGRPEESARTYGRFGWWPLERWVAPYGEGTSVLAADGSPHDALFLLDRALAAVPEDRRCDVQTNRSVALERVGDEAMSRAQEHAAWLTEAQRLAAAGEPTPEDAPWGTWTVDELIDAGLRWSQAAADRYGDAADARQDPSCADQQDQQQQDQAQQDADDLRDRQQQAEDLGDQMQPDQPDQGDQQQQDPPPSTPQDEEQQRQQELEDRNQDAQERAQEEQSDGLTGGGGGGGW